MVSEAGHNLPSPYVGVFPRLVGQCISVTYPRTTWPETHMPRGLMRPGDQARSSPSRSSWFRIQNFSPWWLMRLHPAVNPFAHCPLERWVWLLLARNLAGFLGHSTSCSSLEKKFDRFCQSWGERIVWWFFWCHIDDNTQKIHCMRKRHRATDKLGRVLETKGQRSNSLLMGY